MSSISEKETTKSPDIGPDILEDYAIKPVPSDQYVSGWRVGLIVVGVGITMPAFLEAVELSQRLGFWNSVIAFVTGGAVLTLLAFLTGMIGSKTGLTTYVIAEATFGRKGAHLVNIIMALTLFGWFGVNASMFSDAVIAALGSVGSAGEQAFYTILGGILMTVTTMFGFKALDKLALLVVPPLMLLLLYTLINSFMEADISFLISIERDEMSLGLGISAVIGSNVVGAALMPDYTRYLANRREVFKAAFLGYGLGMPLTIMAIAVPSLAFGVINTVEILGLFGFGLLSLIIIIFTTWTTNTGNLYSASLSLTVVFHRWRSWQVTVASGIAGTVIALLGITDYFIEFLVLLGLAIPPVAAIYIAKSRLGEITYDADSSHYPAFCMKALISWAIAVFVSTMTAAEFFTLTSVAAIDSFFVALIIYFVLVTTRRTVSA